jgi:hypothetical protein
VQCIKRTSKKNNQNKTKVTVNVKKDII